MAPGPTRTTGRGRRGLGRAVGPFAGATGVGAAAGGDVAPDARERCDMCGAAVRLDDRGRCPLGHQVLAGTGEDARVVAVHVEQGPTPAARQAPELAPIRAVPLDVPADGLPAQDVAGSRDLGWDLAPDEPLPLRITDRLRQPLAGGPPLVVPSEDLHPDLVRAHAANATAFAAMLAAGDALRDVDGEHPAEVPTSASAPAPMPVDDPLPPLPAVEPPGIELPAAPASDDIPPSAMGEPSPQPGRASVALGDLAPGAPSALDAVGHLPAGAPAPDPVFEQEPLEDGAEVIPPRTWLERSAAALFVVALLAVAWYLATSL